MSANAMRDSVSAWRHVRCASSLHTCCPSVERAGDAAHWHHVKAHTKNIGVDSVDNRLLDWQATRKAAALTKQPSRRDPTSRVARRCACLASVAGLVQSRAGLCLRRTVLWSESLQCEWTTRQTHSGSSRGFGFFRAGVWHGPWTYC
jgi:hypothetical protein